MKQDIDKPDYIETSWNIRAADNRMRVLLVQRCDINHYYTVLNKRIEIDNDSYRWEKVSGTTKSHGNDKNLALARVKYLIETYNTFS